MHNVLFLIAGVDVGYVFHVIAFSKTTIGGILLGIINEKVFDGKSILPSVLLHGAGNYLETIRVAFMLW
jgi:hypothetical protein